MSLPKAVRTMHLLHRTIYQSHMHHTLRHTPSNRYMHSTTPSYGIMDTIRSSYDTALSNTDTKRQEAVYKSQLTYLTSPNPIDGDVFLSMLQSMKSASGIGGMKEHLPWVSNNPALSEFKQQESIVKALTPAERKNVHKVGIGGVKRVARDVECEIRNVEVVLQQIQSLQHVQKWMKRRIERGGNVPKSSEELQHLMRLEGLGNRRGGGGMKIRPGVKGGMRGRR